MLPDLGVDSRDVEVDGVDAGQHPGQQESVMVIEGAQPKPGEREVSGGLCKHFDGSEH
jgi:hypothetical protein